MSRIQNIEQLYGNYRWFVWFTNDVYLEMPGFIILMFFCKTLKYFKRKSYSVFKERKSKQNTFYRSKRENSKKEAEKRTVFMFACVVIGYMVSWIHKGGCILAQYVLRAKNNQPKTAITSKQINTRRKGRDNVVNLMTSSSHSILVLKLRNLAFPKETR